jgi:hypothetical protein
MSIINQSTNWPQGEAKLKLKTTDVRAVWTGASERSSPALKGFAAIHISFLSGGEACKML